MTLSGRWAAGHHRLLGSTTDKARRLAIALGAVRSIVRVVDRTVPPMAVDWASYAEGESGEIASASYTNFSGHSIRINPAPILDTSIGHGAALDVAAGFGLHEASHSQESRDRYKYLVKREVVTRPNARKGTTEDMEYRRAISKSGTVMGPNGVATREVPAFEPMRVAAYLWNVVEDVRIEQATARNWPGFKPYFGAVLDFMWTAMRKRSDLPTAYGPTLSARTRIAFLACRYPDRLSPTMRADPQLVAEIAWWQAWQHDYLADVADTPTTIQRGLDHLAEDEATKAEMEAEVAAEKREREAGERLRAQIDRLIREGIKGGFAVCAPDNGEMVPLDSEIAEAVRKLVREGLVEHKTIVTAVGCEDIPVLVRKPEETRESRRAYVGRPDATTEALRAALVFRASAPEYSEKLLRSGQIDDEELYRWGAGDYRVFGERVIESKPDVFMGLLVDASGSMYGRKLEIAQRLAQLFVWAVYDQEGIETAVWAHTTEEQASSVFRIWERGDPLSRLGIIDEIDHDSNADGHAIAYVASQIATREQPEKVLVVLSDGIPSAYGYGGAPAMHHVRAVQRWALSRGVRVIQVAVDPRNLRPHEQAMMFGAEGEGWVGFRDYASLPRQIAGLLGRFI